MFTVLFIAFVIVFNVIFTALSEKFLWYIDMTKEGVYTLSDAAKAMLSDMTDEINIYFCSEPDVLEASSEMRYIYTTAKQLEANFPNVHVTCKSVITNNAFFKQFKTEATTQIKTTSVIVQSGTEFRLFEARAFYTFSETTGNVFAYNGEAKFVSAMLSVTASENPIAVFTSTHGEEFLDFDAAKISSLNDLQAAVSNMVTSLYGEVTTTNADQLNSIAATLYAKYCNAFALYNLFKDAGYDVVSIDLTKEEIPESARFVIINNPVYDLLGADAEDESMNEIRKIDNFLDGFGTLIVFADSQYSASFTNLNEFLEEWGVRFRSDTYIKDPDHSVSTDGFSIVGAYSENTLAASLYTEISKLGSTMPKTIVRKAMPIELLYEERMFGSASRDTSAVLKTYDTAQLIENGEVTETGEYNIMTLTRETRIINNQYFYSYVIACGSANFATYSYLVSNTYANSDILYSSMRAMGREKVPADLDFKVFEKYDLDITTAEANNWTVTLCVSLPVVVAIIGVVVYIKRKNS